MGRAKSLDLSPIGRLNSRLPAGIKAVLKRTGTLQIKLFYEVATSYVDPLGRQVKVNLGASDDLVQAIKSLFTWKLDMALQDLPVEILKELQAEIKSGISERSKDLSSLQESGASKRLAESLVSQAEKQSLFAILDTTPIHLIPVEGDMTCSDGLVIPAKILAAWYAHKQEQANRSLGASSARADSLPNLHALHALPASSALQSSPDFPESPESATAETLETSEPSGATESEIAWTEEELAEFKRLQESD